MAYDYTESVCRMNICIINEGSLWLVACETAIAVRSYIAAAQNCVVD